MPHYKAIKEGWDGRQIRKVGEVFPFDGKKGSWMIECDRNGNPVKGEAAPPPERPIRAGASQKTSKTRDALREECRKLGISFGATMGAQQLAELIQNHENEKEKASALAKAEAGKTPAGTGDQDVL